MVAVLLAVVGLGDVFVGMRLFVGVVLDSEGVLEETSSVLGLVGRTLPVDLLKCSV